MSSWLQGPAELITPAHLHVADVLPAPQRLKYAVAEAQHCQVLNQLLA
jgi:hypothetical protein